MLEVQWNASPEVLNFFLCCEGAQRTLEHGHISLLIKSANVVIMNLSWCHKKKKNLSDIAADFNILIYGSIWHLITLILPIKTKNESHLITQTDFAWSGRFPQIKTTYAKLFIQSKALWHLMEYTSFGLKVRALLDFTTSCFYTYNHFLLNKCTPVSYQRTS